MKADRRVPGAIDRHEEAEFTAGVLWLWNVNAEKGLVENDDASHPLCKQTYIVERK